MFLRAKVKTSFPSFTISILMAEPLFCKFVQRHSATCKNAEISVEGKYPFILFQGQCYPGRDGFLANTAEPFTNPALPEKQEHLLFYHSWQQQTFIEIDKLPVRQVLAVKMHKLLFY